MILAAGQLKHTSLRR